MNSLITKIAPQRDAVELDFVKENAKVQFALDDNLLLFKLRAATLAVEHRLGRSLITRTLELHCDAFPTCGGIELRMPPIVSVTSVEYLQADGITWAVMPATDYRAILNGLAPSIDLRSGKAWPTSIEERQSVRVTYISGYGAKPEDVPINIRIWIAMLVASMNEFREADADAAIQRIPFVDGLLTPHLILELR
jgi:uncharacterized phiE125 gp8 family phage protein